MGFDEMERNDMFFVCFLFHILYTFWLARFQLKKVKNTSV